MIIAMAVLMIMGILAAAVWAKTLSGLKYSAYDRTHLSVLGLANSGLDEAVFRLEQIDPSDEDAPTILTGSGAMSGGTFEYEATRKDDLTWEITSTAIVDEVSSETVIRRAIRAEASTTSLFEVAVGGRTQVIFSGNVFNVAQACSFDSTDASNAFGNKCGEDLEKALIGTSGKLTCTGSSDWEDIPVILWPPNGQTSDNNKCENIVPPPPNPYPWEPVVVPTGAKPCPYGGNLTAANVPSIEAGVYSCTNLTLGVGGDQAMCTMNAISQANPIEIYVSGTLEYVGGAMLNVGPKTAGGCWADPVPGSEPSEGPTIDGIYPSEQAGAFRVYKSSTSDIVVPGGNNKPKASMVLYAPYSQFTLNGGPQVYIFGSAMVDRFDTNGAVNVLAYDRALSLITNKKYYVRNWREVRAPDSV